MPERFQIRRVKGWTKPAGGVYATRPGPLGNPFAHADVGYALRAFERYARAAVAGRPFGWVEVDAAGKPTHRFLDARRTTFKTFAGLGEVVPVGRHDRRFVPDPDFPDPLRLGVLPDLDRFKAAFDNLGDAPVGCFCRLDAACHVDVILKLLEESRARSA